MYVKTTPFNAQIFEYKNLLIIIFMGKHLSVDEVKEIRRLHKSHQLLKKELAERFGVSTSTIRNLTTNKTRKDIQEEEIEGFETHCPYVCRFEGCNKSYKNARGRYRHEYEHH